MSNNIAAQTTSLVRRFAEKANCDPHKYNTALETALGVKRPETILAAIRDGPRLSLPVPTSTA